MPRACVLPGRASARSTPACPRGWPCRRRWRARWYFQLQPWIPDAVAFVIPGWSEGPDPESRDSGFALRAPRNDLKLLARAPSRALLREIFGKRLAQFDLAHLAGRGHRHFIEDPDQLRHLEAAEMPAAVFGDSGFIGLRARFQFDERRYRLAPLRMGQADHGGVLHGGMSEQRFLDLYRSDILAAGLDHVLLAGAAQHVAVLVHQRQIARVMPTAFCRR